MEKNFIGSDVNHVKITSLSHIRGQPRVIDNLEVNLRAYFNIRLASAGSNLPFGPAILCGPSGTGKTMVAKAIHAELGNEKLVEINGETVNTKRELFSILLNADSNTTVFIDEAHALNAKAQHILLTVLSEKELYIPASMSSARSHTIPLADFTMIFATTHEYLLQDALRNRMRIYCRFDYYSIEDLTEILRQRATALNWQYESDEVLRTIAQRAKKTPRLALHRNLQTCWHVAKSHDRDIITIADTCEAFCHLQIDKLGLDQLDQAYLHALLEYGRLPLGVLSAKLSLPILTIQRVVEPYLFKEDFVTKDKTSCRVITQKGIEHLKSDVLPSTR